MATTLPPGYSGPLDWPEPCTVCGQRQLAVPGYRFCDGHLVLWGHFCDYQYMGGRRRVGFSDAHFMAWLKARNNLIARIAEECPTLR